MKRMNDTNLRKQQILEIAEKVFLENGYRRTSIEKVAEACGLVKGSVLHYSGSKEKLYQAVLQTRRNQTVDYLEQGILDEGKSVYEILQTTLQICQKQLASNQAFSKEYMKDPSARQSFVEMRIPVYEGLAVLMEKLINKGMESGELQVEDPHLCANAIAFAIFGITNTSSPAECMGREIKRVLETMLGLSFQEG